MASGSLAATFPTLAKISSCATDLQLKFHESFFLGCTKNAYNQLGLSKRYLHNRQLAKANADNETIHIAFRNGWL